MQRIPISLVPDIRTADRSIFLGSPAPWTTRSTLIARLKFHESSIPGLSCSVMAEAPIERRDIPLQRLCHGKGPAFALHRVLKLTGASLRRCANLKRRRIIIDTTEYLV